MSIQTELSNSYLKLLSDQASASSNTSNTVDLSHYLSQDSLVASLLEDAYVASGHFKDNLEAQLKLLNFSEYYFSDAVQSEALSSKNKDNIQLLQNYLKGQCCELSASEQECLLNFFNYAITFANSPLLGLNTSEVDLLQKCVDELCINDVTFDSQALSYKREMNKQLGITNRELYYRDQAYLFSYDTESVTNLVDSLYSDGLLFDTDSEADIVKKVLDYVQSNFKYIEETAGRDNWQSFDETVAAGGGDCEDLAILQSNLLSNIFKNKLGYSRSQVSNKVSLSAGFVKTPRGTGIGHAMVKVKLNQADGTTRDMYLDATSNVAMIPSDAIQFDELFSMNDVTFNKFGNISNGFQTHAAMSNIFLNEKSMYGISETDPYYDDLISSLGIDILANKSAYEKNKDTIVWALNDMLMNITQAINGDDLLVPKQYETMMYRILEKDELEDIITHLEKSLTPEELETEPNLNDIALAALEVLSSYTGHQVGDYDYYTTELTSLMGSVEVDGEDEYPMANWDSGNTISDVRNHILSFMLESDGSVKLGFQDVHTKVTNYEYISYSDIQGLNIDQSYPEDYLKFASYSAHYANFYLLPYQSVGDKGIMTKTGLADMLGLDVSHSDVDAVWNNLITQGVIAQSNDSQDWSGLEDDLYTKLEEQTGIDYREFAVIQGYYGDSFQTDGAEDVVEDDIESLGAGDISGEDQDGLNLYYEIDKDYWDNPLEDENLFDVDWESIIFGTSIEGKDIRKAFMYDELSIESDDFEIHGTFIDSSDVFQADADGKFLSQSLYGLGIAAQTVFWNSQASEITGDAESLNPPTFALEISEFSASLDEDLVAGMLSGINDNATAYNLAIETLAQYEALEAKEAQLKDETNPLLRAELYQEYLDMKEDMYKMYKFIDADMVIQAEDVNSDGIHDKYYSVIEQSYKNQEDEWYTKTYQTRYGFLEVHVDTINGESPPDTLDTDSDFSAVDNVDMITQALVMNSDALFNWTYTIRKSLNQFHLLFQMVNEAMEFMRDQAREIHDRVLDDETKRNVDKARRSADKQNDKFTRLMVQFQSDVNSGVDGVTGQVMDYISAANDAISSKKENDIEGWARVVATEDDVGSFVGSLFLGGATDVVDSFTGGFTYARAVMKHKLSQFQTRMAAANAMHGNNFFALNLLGQKAVVTAEDGSTNTIRQGGIRLWPAMPTTSEDLTTGLSTYADDYGESIIKILAAESGEFDTDEQQKVSKNFLRSYIENIGPVSDFYQPRTEWVEGDGQLVNDYTTNAYTGDSTSLLGMIYNKVAEGLNYSNSLDSVYDDNIDSTYAYSEKDLAASPLIHKDYGGLSTWQGEMGVYSFGDEESEKSVNPFDVIFSILGFGAIISLLVEEMQTAFSEEVPGAESLRDMPLYLDFDYEKQAEFRNRMFRFQAASSLALMVYQMVADKKLEEAKVFGQAAGIKATSAGAALRKATKQALNAELSQFRAGFQKMHQFTSQLVTTTNGLLKNRIELAKATQLMALKIAMTAVMITTTVVINVKASVISGALSNMMAAPVPDPSKLLGAFGMVDPTYWASALLSLLSDMLAMVQSSAETAIEEGAVVYKNPITMIGNYDGEREENIGNADDSPYSESFLANTVTMFGSQLDSFRQDKTFAPDVAERQRIADEQQVGTSYLSYMGQYFSNVYNKDLYMSRQYYAGEMSEFSYIRGYDDHNVETLEATSLTSGAPGLANSGEHGSFFANQGQGSLVSNGLYTAFISQVAKMQLIKIELSVMVVKMLIEAYEQTLADMFNTKKPQTGSSLADDGAFNMIQGVLDIEDQLISDYKAEASQLMGAWNEAAQLDKGVINKQWAEFQSSIASAISSIGFIGGFSVGSTLHQNAMSGVEAGFELLALSLPYADTYSDYHETDRIAEREDGVAMVADNTIVDQNITFLDPLDKAALTTERAPYDPTSDEYIDMVWNYLQYNPFSENQMNSAISNYDRVDAALAYKRRNPDKPADYRRRDKTSGFFDVLTEMETSIFESFYKEDTTYYQFDSSANGLVKESNVDTTYDDGSTIPDYKKELYGVTSASTTFDFDMVYMNPVMETQERLTQVFTMRMMILMFEQAIYQQKQQELQQITGSTVNAGVLSSAMKVVDKYNSMQLDVFSSILDEFNSRVSSKNTYEAEKNRAIISATASLIMGPLLFQQYTKTAQGGGEKQKWKAAKDAIKAGVVKSAVETVSTIIYAVTMFVGTQNRLKELEAEFVDQETEDDEDTDVTSDSLGNEKTSDEKANEMLKDSNLDASSLNSNIKDLSPSKAIQYTPRGGFVANKALLQKIQTATKKRFRKLNLLMKLQDKANDARQEAAAELSGIQTSGARGVLGSVINQFQKSEMAKLQQMFQASETLSQLQNQAIEMLRDKIVKVLSDVFEQIGDAISKRKKNKNQQGAAAATDAAEGATDAAEAAEKTTGKAVKDAGKKAAEEAAKKAAEEAAKKAAEDAAKKAAEDAAKKAAEDAAGSASGQATAKTGGSVDTGTKAQANKSRQMQQDIQDNVADNSVVSEADDVGTDDATKVHKKAKSEAKKQAKETDPDKKDDQHKTTGEKEKTDSKEKAIDKGRKFAAGLLTFLRKLLEFAINPMDVLTDAIKSEHSRRMLNKKAGVKKGMSNSERAKKIREYKRNKIEKQAGVKEGDSKKERDRKVKRHVDKMIENEAGVHRGDTPESAADKVKRYKEAEAGVTDKDSDDIREAKVKAYAERRYQGDYDKQFSKIADFKKNTNKIYYMFLAMLITDVAIFNEAHFTDEQVVDEDGEVMVGEDGEIMEEGEEGAAVASSSNPLDAQEASAATSTKTNRNTRERAVYSDNQKILAGHEPGRDGFESGKRSVLTETSATGAGETGFMDTSYLEDSILLAEMTKYNEIAFRKVLNELRQASRQMGSALAPLLDPRKQMKIHDATKERLDKEQKEAFLESFKALRVAFAADDDGSVDQKMKKLKSLLQQNPNMGLAQFEEHFSKKEAKALSERLRKASTKGGKIAYMKYIDPNKMQQVIEKRKQGKQEEADALEQRFQDEHNFRKLTTMMTGNAQQSHLINQRRRDGKNPLGGYAKFASVLVSIARGDWLSGLFGAISGSLRIAERQVRDGNIGKREFGRQLAKDMRLFIGTYDNFKDAERLSGTGKDLRYPGEPGALFTSISGHKDLLETDIQRLHSLETGEGLDSDLSFQEQLDQTEQLEELNDVKKRLAAMKRHAKHSKVVSAEERALIDRMKQKVDARVKALKAVDTKAKRKERARKRDDQRKKAFKEEIIDPAVANYLDTFFKMGAGHLDDERDDVEALVHEGPEGQHFHDVQRNENMRNMMLYLNSLSKDEFRRALGRDAANQTHDEIRARLEKGAREHAATLQEKDKRKQFNTLRDDYLRNENSTTARRLRKRLGYLKQNTGKKKKEIQSEVKEEIGALMYFSSTQIDKHKMKRLKDYRKKVDQIKRSYAELFYPGMQKIAEDGEDLGEFSYEIVDKLKEVAQLIEVSLGSQRELNQVEKVVFRQMGIGRDEINLFRKAFVSTGALSHLERERLGMLATDYLFRKNSTSRQQTQAQDIANLGILHLNRLRRMQGESKEAFAQELIERMGVEEEARQSGLSPAEFVLGLNRGRARKLFLRQGQEQLMSEMGKDISDDDRLAALRQFEMLAKSNELTVGNLGLHEFRLIESKLEEIYMEAAEDGIPVGSSDDDDPTVGASGESVATESVPVVEPEVVSLEATEVGNQVDVSPDTTAGATGVEATGELAGAGTTVEPVVEEPVVEEPAPAPKKSRRELSIDLSKSLKEQLGQDVELTDDEKAEIEEARETFRANRRSKERREAELEEKKRRLELNELIKQQNRISRAENKRRMARNSNKADARDENKRREEKSKEIREAISGLQLRLASSRTNNDAISARREAQEVFEQSLASIHTARGTVDMEEAMEDIYEEIAAFDDDDDKAIAREQFQAAVNKEVNAVINSDDPADLQRLAALKSAMQSTDPALFADALAAIDEQEAQLQVEGNTDAFNALLETLAASDNIDTFNEAFGALTALAGDLPMSASDSKSKIREALAQATNRIANAVVEEGASNAEHVELLQGMQATLKGTPGYKMDAAVLGRAVKYVDSKASRDVAAAKVKAFNEAETARVEDLNQKAIAEAAQQPATAEQKRIAKEDHLLKKQYESQFGEGYAGFKVVNFLSRRANVSMRDEQKAFFIKNLTEMGLIDQNGFLRPQGRVTLADVLNERDDMMDFLQGQDYDARTRSGNLKLSDQLQKALRKSKYGLSAGTINKSMDKIIKKARKKGFKNLDNKEKAILIAAMQDKLHLDKGRNRNVTVMDAVKITEKLSEDARISEDDIDKYLSSEEHGSTRKSSRKRAAYREVNKKGNANQGGFVSAVRAAFVNLNTDIGGLINLPSEEEIEQTPTPVISRPITPTLIKPELQDMPDEVVKPSFGSVARLTLATAPVRAKLTVSTAARAFNRGSQDDTDSIQDEIARLEDQLKENEEGITGVDEDESLLGLNSLVSVPEVAGPVDEMPSTFTFVHEEDVPVVDAAPVVEPAPAPAPVPEPVPEPEPAPVPKPAPVEPKAPKVGRSGGGIRGILGDFKSTASISTGSLGRTAKGRYEVAKEKYEAALAKVEAAETSEEKKAARKELKHQQGVMTRAQKVDARKQKNDAIRLQRRLETKDRISRGRFGNKFGSRFQTNEAKFGLRTFFNVLGISSLVSEIGFAFNHEANSQTELFLRNKKQFDKPMDGINSDVFKELYEDDEVADKLLRSQAQKYVSHYNKSWGTTKFTAQKRTVAVERLVYETLSDAMNRDDNTQGRKNLAARLMLNVYEANQNDAREGEPDAFEQAMEIMYSNLSLAGGSKNFSDRDSVYHKMRDQMLSIADASQVEGLKKVFAAVEARQVKDETTGGSLEEIAKGDGRRSLVDKLSALRAFSDDDLTRVDNRQEFEDMLNRLPDDATTQTVRQYITGETDFSDADTQATITSLSASQQVVIEAVRRKAQVAGINQGQDTTNIIARSTAEAADNASDLQQYYSEHTLTVDQLSDIIKAVEEKENKNDEDLELLEELKNIEEEAKAAEASNEERYEDERSNVEELVTSGVAGLLKERLGKDSDISDASSAKALISAIQGREDSSHILDALVKRLDRDTARHISKNLGRLVSANLEAKQELAERPESDERRDAIKALESGLVELISFSQEFDTAQQIGQQSKDFIVGKAQKNLETLVTAFRTADDDEKVQMLEGQSIEELEEAIDAAFLTGSKEMERLARNLLQEMLLAAKDKEDSSKKISALQERIMARVSQKERARESTREVEVSNKASERQSRIADSLSEAEDTRDEELSRNVTKAFTALKPPVVEQHSNVKSQATLMVEKHSKLDLNNKEKSLAQFKGFGAEQMKSTVTAIGLDRIAGLPSTASAEDVQAINEAFTASPGADAALSTVNSMHESMLRSRADNQPKAVLTHMRNMALMAKEEMGLSSDTFTLDDVEALEARIDSFMENPNVSDEAKNSLQLMRTAVRQMFDIYNFSDKALKEYTMRSSTNLVGEARDILVKSGNDDAGAALDALDQIGQAVHKDAFDASKDITFGEFVRRSQESQEFDELLNSLKEAKTADQRNAIRQSIRQHPAYASVASQLPDDVAVTIDGMQTNAGYIELLDGAQQKAKAKYLDLGEQFSLGEQQKMQQAVELLEDASVNASPHDKAVLKAVADGIRQNLLSSTRQLARRSIGRTQDAGVQNEGILNKATDDVAADISAKLAFDEELSAEWNAFMPRNDAGQLQVVGGGKSLAEIRQEAARITARLPEVKQREVKRAFEDLQLIRARAENDEDSVAVLMIQTSNSEVEMLHTCNQLGIFTKEDGEFTRLGLLQAAFEVHAGDSDEQVRASQLGLTRFLNLLDKKDAAGREGHHLIDSVGLSKSDIQTIRSAVREQILDSLVHAQRQENPALWAKSDKLMPTLANTGDGNERFGATLQERLWGVDSRDSVLDICHDDGLSASETSKTKQCWEGLQDPIGGKKDKKGKKGKASKKGDKQGIQQDQAHNLRIAHALSTAIAALGENGLNDPRVLRDIGITQIDEAFDMIKRGEERLAAIAARIDAAPSEEKPALRAEFTQTADANYEELETALGTWFDRDTDTSTVNGEVLAQIADIFEEKRGDDGLFIQPTAQEIAVKINEAMNTIASLDAADRPAAMAALRNTIAARMAEGIDRFAVKGTSIFQQTRTTHTVHESLYSFERVAVAGEGEAGGAITLTDRKYMSERMSKKQAFFDTMAKHNLSPEVLAEEGVTELGWLMQPADGINQEMRAQVLAYMFRHDQRDIRQGGQGGNLQAQLATLTRAQLYTLRSAVLTMKEPLFLKDDFGNESGQLEQMINDAIRNTDQSTHMHTKAIEKASQSTVKKVRRTKYNQNPNLGFESNKIAAALTLINNDLAIENMVDRDLFERATNPEQQRSPVQVKQQMEAQLAVLKRLRGMPDVNLPPAVYDSLELSLDNLDASGLVKKRSDQGTAPLQDRSIERASSLFKKQVQGLRAGDVNTAIVLLHSFENFPEGTFDTVEANKIRATINRALSALSSGERPAVGALQKHFVKHEANVAQATQLVQDIVSGERDVRDVNIDAIVQNSDQQEALSTSLLEALDSRSLSSEESKRIMALLFNLHHTSTSDVGMSVTNMDLLELKADSTKGRNNMKRLHKYALDYSKHLARLDSIDDSDTATYEAALQWVSQHKAHIAAESNVSAKRIDDMLDKAMNKRQVLEGGIFARRNVGKSKAFRLRKFKAKLAKNSTLISAERDYQRVLVPLIKQAEENHDTTDPDLLADALIAFSRHHVDFSRLKKQRNREVIDPQLNKFDFKKGVEEFDSLVAQDLTNDGGKLTKRLLSRGRNADGSFALENRLIVAIGVALDTRVKTGKTGKAKKLQEEARKAAADKAQDSILNMIRSALNQAESDEEKMAVFSFMEKLFPRLEKLQIPRLEDFIFRCRSMMFASGRSQVVTPSLFLSSEMPGLKEERIGAERFTEKLVQHLIKQHVLHANGTIKHLPAESRLLKLSPPYDKYRDHVHALLTKANNSARHLESKPELSEADATELQAIGLLNDAGQVVRGPDYLQSSKQRIDTERKALLKSNVVSGACSENNVPTGVAVGDNIDTWQQELNLSDEQFDVFLQDMQQEQYIDADHNILPAFLEPNAETARSILSSVAGVEAEADSLPDRYAVGDNIDAWQGNLGLSDTDFSKMRDALLNDGYIDASNNLTEKFVTMSADAIKQRVLTRNVRIHADSGQGEHLKSFYQRLQQSGRMYMDTESEAYQRTEVSDSELAGLLAAPGDKPLWMSTLGITETQYHNLMHHMKGMNIQGLETVEQQRNAVLGIPITDSNKSVRDLFELNQQRAEANDKLERFETQVSDAAKQALNAQQNAEVDFFMESLDVDRHTAQQLTLALKEQGLYAGGILSTSVQSLPANFIAQAGVEASTDSMGRDLSPNEVLTRLKALTAKRSGHMEVLKLIHRETGGLAVNQTYQDMPRSYYIDGYLRHHPIMHRDFLNELAEGPGDNSYTLLRSLSGVSKRRFYELMADPNLSPKVKELMLTSKMHGLLKYEPARLRDLGEQIEEAFGPPKADPIKDFEEFMKELRAEMKAHPEHADGMHQLLMMARDKLNEMAVVRNETAELNGVAHQSDPTYLAVKARYESLIALGHAEYSGTITPEDQRHITRTVATGQETVLEKFEDMVFSDIPVPPRATEDRTELKAINEDTVSPLDVMAVFQHLDKSGNSLIKTMKKEVQDKANEIGQTVASYLLTQFWTRTNRTSSKSADVTIRTVAHVMRGLGFSDAEISFDMSDPVFQQVGQEAEQRLAAVRAPSPELLRVHKEATESGSVEKFTQFFSMVEQQTRNQKVIGA